MDEKLAPVRIESDDEAANRRLNDVAAELNRVAAQPGNLRLEVSNLKRDECPADWSGMPRVRLRDHKGNVAELILEPIVAQCPRLNGQGRAVETARDRDVADWISYKRDLWLHRDS